MCELFAVSAGEKVRVTELLKEFFSHSREHSNGWGIAVFEHGVQNVEREPVRASASSYLKSRLAAGFEVTAMMAHIRKATMGHVEYRNTHPVVKRDESGRTWTLIHNGTVFEPGVLNPYVHRQEGTTDSERILLYLVDRINENLEDALGSFDVNERFRVAEDVVRILAPGNKLNLVFSDGEYLYVHKNAPGTLYILEDGKGVFFSTRPLGKGDWNEVPQNQLLIYKDGQRIHVGAMHTGTYVENEEQIRMLYLEYAGL